MDKLRNSQSHLSSFTSATTEKLRFSKNRAHEDRLYFTKKFSTVLEQTDRKSKNTSMQNIETGPIRYRNQTNINAKYSLERSNIPKLKTNLKAIRNSNSLNIKSKNVNSTESSDLNDKELMIFKEKAMRLKQAYNQQNKKPLPKISVSTKSNAKINSIKDFSPHQNQKDFKRMKNQNRTQNQIHTQNHKKLASKQKSKTQANSMRILPKFLDYCSKNDGGVISFLNSSNIPPKLSSQKMTSMKNISISPPLIPVTIEPTISFTTQISIEWVRQSYQPNFEPLRQSIRSLNLVQKKYQFGIYIGEIDHETNQKQGLGVVFYKNGKIFEGSFHLDEKEGKGYEKYTDGSYYAGCFHHGKREGRGLFEWNNKESYDGEWKGGKKHGSGIWKGNDQISYVGEWRNDLIQGFGVLIDKDYRYEGQFKNFTKSGNGSLKFANGQIYCGEFKNNLPNGMGDFYWPNGDHYKGEFRNGKRHGHGVLKCNNGGTYSGNFHNDKKSGLGEQTYEQELFYVGNFENDLRHGWGVLYCDNYVRLFQGYWLNNQAVDGESAFQAISEQDKCKASIIQGNRRNKMLAKRQDKSKLAFKVFKEKHNSKSKDKSQQKSVQKFKRDCNCDRHRQCL